LFVCFVCNIEIRPKHSKSKFESAVYGLFIGLMDEEVYISVIVIYSSTGKIEANSLLFNWQYLDNSSISYYNLAW
jgi:hypothetical protein